jgi:hypothetical protein
MYGNTQSGRAKQVTRILVVGSVRCLRVGAGNELGGGRYAGVAGGAGHMARESVSLERAPSLLVCLACAGPREVPSLPATVLRATPPAGTFPPPLTVSLVYDAVFSLPSPAARQVDFNPFGPKRPPMAIPPNSSGFGSDEDSLQNVLHLVPRPVTHSYTDYLNKWNKVMRFAAVMVPLGPGRPLVGPHDAERRCVGAARWVGRGQGRHVRRLGKQSRPT